jgi:predicted TIM-barrel fold metal-dependent hydrolase
LPELFEIVDAQIHEPTAPQALPPQCASLVKVEMAREALDSVGVDAALLVTDRAFIDACRERYPQRFAGVITFDPASATLEQDVRTVSDTPGLVAGRALVGDFRDGTLRPAFSSGGFEPLFALAQSHHVPLFASTHGWAAVLDDVATRYPDLILIVDHLGVSQSPYSPPRPEPWDRLPDLLKLARHRNVFVKVCGVPVLARESFPYKDAWPYLHSVIDAFGAERLMWASDYTRMRHGGRTYSESRDYLLRTDEISDEQKGQIFGGTVRRVLNWGKT